MRTTFENRIKITIAHKARFEKPFFVSKDGKLCEAKSGTYYEQGKRIIWLTPEEEKVARRREGLTQKARKLMDRQKELLVEHLEAKLCLEETYKEDKDEA
jgi:hypothetical protein